MKYKLSKLTLMNIDKRRRRLTSLPVARRSARVASERLRSCAHTLKPARRGGWKKYGEVMIRCAPAFARGRRVPIDICIAHEESSVGKNYESGDLSPHSISCIESIDDEGVLAARRHPPDDGGIRVGFAESRQHLFWACRTTRDEHTASGLWVEEKAGEGRSETFVPAPPLAGL